MSEPLPPIRTPVTESAPQVVLASASKARQSMLTSAGIVCTCHAAHVDEGAVKDSLRAEGASAGDVGEVLAELKAMRVSRHYPQALVIGADQMLDCGDLWLDKAPDRATARANLIRLRDATHQLVSCAVVVQDGKRLWHHRDSATLTMRPFSDEFLDRYLDTLGDRAFETVGVYHLEGLGAQLFSRVVGDVFTIMGLPLIPLMGFLRAHGVLID